MKDAEMIAREIANIINGTYRMAKTLGAEFDVDAEKLAIILRPVLREKHRAGYEAAREQAARVAEGHDDPNPYPTRQGAIATTIRSMEPDDVAP